MKRKPIGTATDEEGNEFYILGIVPIDYDGVSFGFCLQVTPYGCAGKVLDAPLAMFNAAKIEFYQNDRVAFLELPDPVEYEDEPSAEDIMFLQNEQWFVNMIEQMEVGDDLQSDLVGG